MINKKGISGSVKSSREELSSPTRARGCCRSSNFPYTPLRIKKAGSAKELALQESAGSGEQEDELRPYRKRAV